MRVFRISCAGCEFSTRGGRRETREERGGTTDPDAAARRTTPGDFFSFPSARQ
ncbi:hypothetical protein XENOCAPTIV_010754, partial [Xenoophorus captivus]